MRSFIAYAQKNRAKVATTVVSLIWGLFTFVVSVLQGHATDNELREARQSLSTAQSQIKQLQLQLQDVGNASLVESRRLERELGDRMRLLLSDPSAYEVMTKRVQAAESVQVGEMMREIVGDIEIPVGDDVYNMEDLFRGALLDLGYYYGEDSSAKYYEGQFVSLGRVYELSKHRFLLSGEVGVGNERHKGFYLILVDGVGVTEVFSANSQGSFELQPDLTFDYYVGDYGLAAEGEVCRFVLDPATLLIDRYYVLRTTGPNGEEGFCQRNVERRNH